MGESIEKLFFQGNRYVHGAGFLILVVWLFFAYHHYEIMQYGPVSIHRWRQADSASQALCYYKEGMNFFTPHVNNVAGGNSAAASEFPILYYITALMYFVFGIEDNILRILDYLIFLAGVFGFSRIILRVTQSPLIALGAAAVFLGSPLLAFYGFNYIPNTPALGFVLVSAWFFDIYVRKRKVKWYLLSALSLCLAGLLKPPLLLVLVAYIMVWITWKAFYVKEDNAFKRFYPSTPVFWGVMTAVLLINLAWIIYMKDYNEKNNSGIFLTSIKPIWSMSEGNIRWTTENLWNIMMPKVFLRETIWVMIAGIAAVFAFFPKLRVFLRWGFLFLILGELAYYLLFYEQLLIHDYYLIELFPLLFLVFGILLYLMRGFLQNRLYHAGLILLLLVFANMNIISAKKHVTKVISPDNVEMSGISPAFYETEELREYARSLGVEYAREKGLVLSIPDGSPNITLYYLEARGLTKSTADLESLTNEQMENLKKWGWEYLIIHDKSLLDHETLKPFLSHPIGVFRDEIYFFKL